MLKFLTSIIYLSAILAISSLYSCSISKQISRQASATILKDSAVNTGNIGISIYEPATGKYWYSHNDTHYFIPASNTKLFTLYAGMKYLGDSLVGLRYQVFNMPHDTITEITPSGDPTFLLSEFQRQPVLDFLKTRKKIVLHNLPDINPWGMGWAWDDYKEPFMAPRSTFPMYGDVINIRWINKDSISVTPKYFWNEAEKMYAFENGLSAFKKMGSNHLIFTSGTYKSWNTTFEPDVDTQIKLLEENIPGLNIFFVTSPLVTPLASKQIVQNNRSNEEKTDLTAMLRYEEVKSRYLNDTVVRTIHSQPTDSLFKPMMHRSDNFFAEQTLLMVSNEHLGIMNDEKIIDTILKTDLKDVPQRPKWVDGSGLSRYNLFTPQSFVYILNKMKDEFGIARMKNILATGGEGTIASYFKKDSGYIYAKTGTLSNNCALSGYLITRKGKLLIFSILANNYITGATPVRRATERFLESIREKY
ncbi:MAG: D-alanyl-D-alanine carboxypeptidase [Bacteroidetes bacterium]|nr:D-alanyl-D-alanine carboxypeptidase [Bacteroidota bacterium]